MKRVVGLAVGLSVIASLAFVAAVPLTASSSARPVLTFDSFVGVSGHFLGSEMPLRGVSGGGLPWVIASGTAKLKANGELAVEVDGLVIDPSNATAQTKGLAGVNPAPYFFATLSCVDNSGAVTNVNTNPVPATASGNAKLDQMLTLPSSCFAPILLVRGSFSGSPSGPWFAVSGF
ncbi:MAG TPA: hypothetical protein VEY12_03625 [Thermoplasmata archaeon]|nr:hypothetical protein [Thermoplasmata archaeon]